jgi:hypothetical protein
MMSNEREALLNKIRQEKDTPRIVSMKRILRWVERMQPQDEAMRAYLISYFSAPTLKEKQAIKAAKLATLTAVEQQIFLEKWWQCVGNDMSNQPILSSYV